MKRKRKHINVIAKSETAIYRQFAVSMENDNQKRKQLNAPIARYDVAKKSAYYEYPDGRIVYADEA